MDLFLLISVLHANFYWMGVLGKMMCSLEGNCSWESYGEGAGGICYLEYLLCGIYQYPLPPTEGLNFVL